MFDSQMQSFRKNSTSSALSDTAKSDIPQYRTVYLLCLPVEEGEMKTKYPIMIAGANFGCGSSREVANHASGFVSF